MAERYDDFGLKEAILQVWTPAVGLQSIEDIWNENLTSVFPTNRPKFPGIVELFCKIGIQNPVKKYFDEQRPFQLKKSTVSGSWSEGLFVFFESSGEITPPDIDFMCVLDNINFTASDQICGNLTVREDTPFVKAYITDETCATLWKDFFHDSCDQSSSNKHQLSAFKLKEKLRENYHRVGNLFRHASNTAIDHVHSEEEKASFMVSNHRPVDCTPIFNANAMRSFTNALYEASNFLDEVKIILDRVFYRFLPSTDIVLAFSCDGWPLSANDWITRERSWPDEELVNKIAQGGFHIVPKSSPEGDFRLSFSFAETTLIKHWSPLQHKVMRSFKAVVKCHQSIWSSNIKEIISTYHLKTIAFWHFEKIAQDSFSEETVVTHLVLLLQELAEALMKLELPMYFMPKVNLLKSLEDYEDAVDTAEKIFHLSRDYVAITHTVAKLAKMDFNATRTNILKDIHMVWKSVRKAKSSDVEDQLATLNLILNEVRSLLVKQRPYRFCKREDIQCTLDTISDVLLKTNLIFRLPMADLRFLFELLLESDLL